jgi:hypothetical protein
MLADSVLVLSIMRRLLLRRSVPNLVHGVGDKGLELLEAARDRLERSLLLVNHVAELINESLEIRVPGFEFGQSLVIHAASLERLSRQWNT